MNYNKPAIPKGTCGKFCFGRLLHVDNQLIKPYCTLAILGFSTPFYTLISVYFGTFR